MRFVLLHSPFLGPSTWSALLPVLEDRGCEALAPNLQNALKAGAGAYERVAEQVGELMSDGAVLVVHSGAGALVPSIQQAAASSLEKVVFMDALLPHPGRSWFDTLQPAVADSLRNHAIDGCAPPWPAWLPAGMLDQLLPASQVRAAFVNEAANMPLAYLARPAPDIEHWQERLVLGYLQLSEAYANEADTAERLGWCVDRLTGNHLSMMTRPQMVGESVLRLVARLRSP